MKPIIGITLDEQFAGGYSPYPWYAIRKNYMEAVSTFGAIPIFIPYDFTAIEDYLKLIDGLLIPGGDFDIHPRYYNEELTSHVRLGEQRVEFELKLMEQILKTKIPFLGICNGEQILNVTLGGSLIQYIPEAIETDINHLQTQEKHLPTHEIIVKPNSLLHKITGNERFMVNSTHQQAINKVGNNLIASAIAPDGIIEAIELPSHPFCLGVEWHPEYLTTIEDKLIFKSFIEAATDYSNSKI